jgi:predicted NAD/FAD-dependent oxidoreductase
MAPTPASPDPTEATVAIVGAGMAGLVCARELTDAGVEGVVVLDKGRGVGGRLATRRIGEARLDHGAQYVTARSDGFSGAVGQWVADGVMRPWFTTPRGEQAYSATAGMTGVAKALAAGVRTETGVAVTAVAPGDAGWRLQVAGRAPLGAKVVVLTAPVPQSLALLAAGGVRPDATTAARLAAITYDPCVSVLAVLDAPSGVPAPGWLASDDPAAVVAWLADNHQKGISAVPALTVQTGVAATGELWPGAATPLVTGLTPATADGAVDAAVAATVLGAVADQWGAGVLGHGQVVATQVMRWRYARVATPDPGGTLAASVGDGRLSEVGDAGAPGDGGPLVVFAGDGFAGARVEAAAASGAQAASVVAGRL